MVGSVGNWILLILKLDRFLVRLMQGLVSIKTIITRRFIIYRCKGTDGSYIDYPPVLQVVTVLDLQRT